MYRFDEKQFGRIFTDKEENILKIQNIIKEIDEDEFEYLPENLIIVYKGGFDTTYNGKFYDIDLDELINRCNKQHITCGIVKAHQDYSWEFDEPILDQESLGKCIRQFYESGFWTKEQVLEHYRLSYLM
jgi:hypothetical protein